jgi:hypothetical protein
MGSASCPSPCTPTNMPQQPQVALGHASQPLRGSVRSRALSCKSGLQAQLSGQEEVGPRRRQAGKGGRGTGKGGVG